MFDPLPADLESALQNAAPGLAHFGRLHYRAEVESTNDIALSLAAAGEPEGTSVLAEAQQQGRGRRGRDWFSPAGAGLYLSLLARPRVPGGLSLITLAAGVAAARAVRDVTGLPVELKWPNDLVVGRPWRKLGGVLCEATGTSARVETIVVGIGVNLLRVAYPREIAGRATSIEGELGRVFERAPLVVALLGEVRGVVDCLHAGDRRAIWNAWREFGHAGLSGVAVRWHDSDAERHGRARDIDDDGALIVDTENGVERVISGEVKWEGLSRD